MRSRTFSFNPESPKDYDRRTYSILCPLVDTINHEFTPNSYIHGTFSLVDNDSYVLVKSKREIEAGEEITINYGNYSNHDLLMKYGFTVENNPFNEFPFTLELDNPEFL